MRICRFRHNGRTSYGIYEFDSVEYLDGEPFGGFCRTDERVDFDDVTLLAPVTPPNIIAVGANYQEHINETRSATPERPLVFLKATTAVIGPGEPIVLPRMAPDEVDYEGELAIVIGMRARHVSETDALQYVFGYTCANDVSARDCQLRLDRQWARGKSFDTFCPLGPWIETNLAPANLRISTRLNDRSVQDSTTANMIFDCRKLISYLSQCMTLLPGTVILTGTPDGVGMAQDPAVFLKAGDQVSVEIQGIGSLTNPVIAEE